MPKKLLAIPLLLVGCVTHRTAQKKELKAFQEGFSRGYGAGAIITRAELKLKSDLFIDCQSQLPDKVVKNGMEEAAERAVSQTNAQLKEKEEKLNKDLEEFMNNYLPRGK